MMVDQDVSNTGGSDRYARAAAQLGSIVAEMKRIGFWSEQVVPQVSIKQRSAYGLGSLPFVQWLQYIFIPSAQEIVEDKAPFPGFSLVGAMAVREFDGIADAEHLIDLLCEFDQLFI